MPDAGFTVNTGRVDVPLTNLVVKFGVPELLAPRLFPVQMHDGKRGEYYILGDDGYRIVDDAVGTRGKANEESFTLSTDTFKIEPHGLWNPLSDMERKNINHSVVAEAMNNVNRAEYLKGLIMARWEYNVAQLLLTAANYNSDLYEDLDDVENRNFDDSSGPGGLTIINEYLDEVELKCGRRPNLVVASRDTYRQMQVDTNFRVESLEAKATKQKIADLLEVDEFIVANKSWYNAGARGAAASRTRNYGSNYLLAVHQPAAFEKYTPAIGRTFRWDAIDGATNGECVKTVRAEMEGVGVDYVGYFNFYGLKLTGVNSDDEIISGCLLANCYNSI